MSELAGITEPAPVTLVVFGGEASYVNTTCEIVDRVFAGRVEYVFANSHPQLYGEVSERFDASTFAIAMPDVCQGLRDPTRF